MKIRSTTFNIMLAAFIIISSLLIVFIFGLLAYQVYFLDRVHWGVLIGGVDVSKMTRPEVEQVVNKQANQLLSRPITLVSNQSTHTLSAAELGARIDIQPTVDLAFSVGRTGQFLADLSTQWQATKQSINISPIVNFETGPVNQVLHTLATNINRPPRNAQLTLHQNLELEMVTAQTGLTVDIEANRKAIRQALTTADDTPLTLIIYSTQPAITEVEQTYTQLTNLLSQPIILTFNKQQWSLLPQTLAPMLTIAPTQDSTGVGRITATFDQIALATYFHTLALEINQLPVDAWFNLDAETWTLTPTIESQVGYTLDVQQAVNQINNLLQGPVQHRLALPVIEQQPAVSMENTDNLGIKELVSSSTTYFKGSSADRMKNISVAASKFHGLVIPPGEIFSFNKYLGDVNADSGFVESLIIQGDRTAVGMGGGVCQVSTTAFRTAFEGGFEIVERWAHGYRVGWYETGVGPGLDATIYTPVVDFKFRNDTDSYILIQTETNTKTGTVTFNFYGTSPNRTVTISEPTESNKITHGPAIYIKDPTLAPGEVQQIDWAKDGVDVTVTRTVKENDITIHSDTIFSRYRPWQAKYLVGPPAEDEEDTQKAETSS